MIRTARRLAAVAILGAGLPAYAGDALARGQAVYQRTCIACHGANGGGVMPGIRDLASRNGPLTQPDAVLIANIVQGYRRPGTRLMMPPKGGNPALTEEDIRVVLRYMRKTFGVSATP